MRDALAQWRQLVGDEHVVEAPVATTTFATTQRTAAVIRPADRAQVAACVKIAHTHGIPLHPISRGRNWGYGGRVPPRDNSVAIDLARLDRILDFDERLAHVTVEPGVTFQQLSRYLRVCRARVFASCTGGPPDGSVIANALERGDGSGPLGDRFAHVAALEVVLPDGERIETGFGRFGGATVPLGAWGVGPVLDGLFSQSSLGIVTRMTIWLTPYPASYQIGAWTADDLDVVDVLRGLRLSGVVTSATSVWNDIKLLAALGPCPPDEALPLSHAARARLRAKHRIGRWNGTVSLYAASDAHGAALRELVTDALGNIPFREGPNEPLDADEADCGPALGVPVSRNVASMYWRKRAVGVDPDADGCGFIWLSHAVPFDGKQARIADELVEAHIGAFEPNVAFLGVTPRLLQMVVAIAYDRAIDGEDARAMACHDALLAALVAAGYPPFRSGIQAPHPGRGASAAYDRLVDAIGAAIDPRGILYAAPTTSSRR